MTPGQTRTALSLFVALAAGVAGNAMLLQSSPANTAAAKASAERSAQKASLERQKRLAADSKPASVASDPSTAAAPAIINAPRTSQRQPDPGPIPLDEIDKRPSLERVPQRLAAGPGPQAAIRLARIRPDAAIVTDQMPDAPDVEGGPETIKAVQRELSNRGYGPVQADGVPGLLTRAAIMAFEHDTKSPLTGEATEALLKRLLLGASNDRPADPLAGKARTPQAETIIRTVQQSLTALGYQPGKSDGRVGEETERAIREFEMDQTVTPTGRISADLFSRLAKSVSGIKTATPR